QAGFREEVAECAEVIVDVIGAITVTFLPVIEGAFETGLVDHRGANDERRREAREIRHGCNEDAPSIAAANAAEGFIVLRIRIFRRRLLRWFQPERAGAPPQNIYVAGLRFAMKFQVKPVDQEG